MTNIIPELNADDVRRAFKALNELDKQIVKDLRKDLRTQLSPMAQAIAASVPGESPLRGMKNGGRTGWSAVRPSVSITPGRGRRSYNRLVSINITPIENRVGVSIAELAGSRSNGFTPSGRAMISKLNENRQMKGRGGRYIYDAFVPLRPDVVAIATRILDQTFAKLDRKI